jgi:ABC-type nickel/cobalt efflux system permease component RcnA
MIHGMCGVLYVMGIHYILKKSINASLGTVSNITQIISFSLIILLGLYILTRNSLKLFSKKDQTDDHGHSSIKKESKSLLAYAFAVGLVPCTGVIMVMLFCMSLRLMTLGVFLSLFISIGMSITISFFVLLVVLSKKATITTLSKKGSVVIHRIIGLISGLTIITLGIVFLLAAIR